MQLVTLNVTKTKQTNKQRRFVFPTTLAFIEANLSRSTFSFTRNFNFKA